MVELLSIPRYSKFYLIQQIGSLERGLTKWNEDEFGNVIFKKNQLTIEHKEFDSMEEIRHLSDEEMQKTGSDAG